MSEDKVKKEQETKSEETKQKPKSAGLDSKSRKTQKSTDKRSSERKTDDKKSYDRSRDNKKSDRPYKKFNRRSRKKVCKFCENKVKEIDYKDIKTLTRYTSEKGKIISRRQTGVCAAHQRKLTKAIKKARVASLMPFAGE